jgi:hypothetical protein
MDVIVQLIHKGLAISMKFAGFTYTGDLDSIGATILKHTATPSKIKTCTLAASSGLRTSVHHTRKICGRKMQDIGLIAFFATFNGLGIACCK